MDKVINKKIERWNESYERKENYIFYPHDEVVKFINRFIRKRVGVDSFVDIIYKGESYKSGIGLINALDCKGGGDSLKALDFGCGIGRQTLLLKEFGIEAWGIDISQVAINEAKNLAKLYDKYDTQVNFQVYDGENIPFEDKFFDFAISYGVLDSMPFSLAKKLICGIERVVKKYCFITLIGEDSTSLFSNLSGECRSEIEVQDAHEFGTIQSFFDKSKIEELIVDSSFFIKWGQKIQHIDIQNNAVYSRYFILLEKGE